MIEPWIEKQGFMRKTEMTPEFFGNLFGDGGEPLETVLLFDWEKDNTRISIHRDGSVSLWLERLPRYPDEEMDCWEISKEMN